MRVLRILLITLLSFYALLGFFMYYLHSQITIYADSKEYITVNDDKIVIFAAHQDDGVIMAGGYAMQ